MGGEVWHTGTSYRIRWRGGIPSLPVDIFIHDGKSLRNLATGFKNTGVYFWVPDVLGQFRVILRNAATEIGTYQPVTSNSFTIVHPSPPNIREEVASHEPHPLIHEAPRPLEEKTHPSDTTRACGWCEEASAVFSCVTCETNYCQVCDTMVHGKKAMQNHKRVSLLSEPISRFCTELDHHVEKLNLFCNLCKVSVCSLCCLVGVHKGHHCETAESAKRKLAVQNEASLAKASELRLSLLENLAKVDVEIARRTEMREAADAFTFFGLLKAMGPPLASPCPPRTPNAAHVSAARVLRDLASPATAVNTKFTGSFDTNGILYFLGTNFGTESYEHPAKRGLVRCSRSSEGTGTADGMFGWIQTQNSTQNVPASWATISFVNHEIAPLHYSILNSRGSAHSPRNWKLQALDKNGHWIDLATHVQDSTLQHPKQPFVYRSIADPTRQLYSSFRVLQTGLDACDSNSLAMGGFEIYGFLAVRQ